MVPSYNERREDFYMRLPTLKAKGQQGSWFADVAGESIPCVHDYHCTWKEGAYYNQPSKTPSVPRYAKYAEAIREAGYVIVAKDAVTKDENGDLSYKRIGYVGVFTVENVELDEKGLRFRIISRVANLS
jgi:hypothetical protein